MIHRQAKNGEKENKMKINSVDNTNFQALYATPQTLKKIGCTKEMLLNNPFIKDCAEKYDVVVTAGKKKYVIDRHDGFSKDKILPTAYLLGTIISAPHVADWMTALGVTSIETILGAGFTMLALAGLSIIKLVTQRINEINIQGASRVDDKYNPLYYEEFRTYATKTPVYTVRRDALGNISEIPSLTKQINETEYKCLYWSALKHAKFDDIFTPKKYLAELEKIEKAAEEFYIKDVFGFPVNKGGDTLLTVFFDVAIPDKNDKEEMEAYYKILQKISKTDKSNFDKNDSHGISILEKIMNSENTYILPILKGSKFSYSPFLKYAYDNIQDSTFKNQLKLSIDFNFDLLEGKK